jgi:hypothetical protein
MVGPDGTMIEHPSWRWAPRLLLLPAGFGNWLLIAGSRRLHLAFGIIVGRQHGG